MEFTAIIAAIVATIFIARAVKVVPQQSAWVVERLGKYHATLTPGLNFLIPFVDSIAHKHIMKEIPFDVTKERMQMCQLGLCLMGFTLEVG